MNFRQFMENDQEGFIKAIIDKPYDDALRNVFADWLEEHAHDPNEVTILRNGKFPMRTFERYAPNYQWHYIRWIEATDWHSLVTFLKHFGYGNQPLQFGVFEGMHLLAAPVHNYPQEDGPEVAFLVEVTYTVGNTISGQALQHYPLIERLILDSAGIKH